MVPISKSIYIHTSSEYCQLFLNESPAKFLIRWQKTFSGIAQNPPLPKFSARFCARCSILSKNLLFVQFCCTRKPLHRDGTGGGGFGETGKVSAAFRGDQAFAALFLVAWIKMASMATAKRTPTGYATAVL